MVTFKGNFFVVNTYNVRKKKFKMQKHQEEVPQVK